MVISSSFSFSIFYDIYNKMNIMNEPLIEIIKNSKSRNQVLLSYFGYNNKSAYNYLNEFIEKNKINTTHLNKKTKLCPNCGKIVTKRSNKFCNSSCSASFTNKNKTLCEETKLKIRISLKGRKQSEERKDKIRGEKNGRWMGGTYIYLKEDQVNEKICIICRKEFTPNKISKGRLSNSKFCSSMCRNKHLSQLKIDDVKNGTHKGWKTRNIESYPEKFFKKVLKNNKIDFEYNYPVNKRDLGLKDSSNYFLDFYMEEKRIDLEIDGKQHNERQEYDKERDIILIKNGYNVYRIKWKNISSEKGKKYMKEEINKFLNYYSNMVVIAQQV
jgi:very-short-patch-repair endonuclease